MILWILITMMVLNYFMLGQVDRRVNFHVCDHILKKKNLEGNI